MMYCLWMSARIPALITACKSVAGREREGRKDGERERERKRGRKREENRESKDVRK
jgi:hypothetical protein